MRPRRFLFTFITLFLAVSLVVAQDTDCVAQLQAIIEAAQTACPKVAMNEACYASAPLTVQPHPNVRIDFGQPGDVGTLAALESLTGSPFDPATGEGTIAVMNVRANLPEGSVTMIVYGDFLVENRSAASADFLPVYVTVREPSGANVRALPTTDSQIVGQLNAQETYLAIGRTEDGTWINILRRGWVSAELLRTSGDLRLLEVLPADAIPVQDEYPYGTMQALHLRAALDDSPCEGAPDSGLLVQVSDQASSAVLEVNGLPLAFTGTIFLQTTAEGDTVVSVLEGFVDYDPKRTPLIAKNQLRYGYRGEEMTFFAVEDYDYAHLRYLPFVLLPRQIELPFSLGGLVQPFTPGTGFLNNIPIDGTCTVAWSGDVNIRSGPGTNYPIRQGVPGGFYAEPDARAVGTDGRVWWRLSEAVWIAADATVGAGACGTLPLVEPPPIVSG